MIAGNREMQRFHFAADAHNDSDLIVYIGVDVVVGKVRIPKFVEFESK